MSCCEKLVFEKEKRISCQVFFHEEYPKEGKRIKQNRVFLQHKTGTKN